MLWNFVPNKLECLAWKAFPTLPNIRGQGQQPVQAGKPESAPPRQALTLLANIELGWKNFKDNTSLVVLFISNE